MGRRGGARAPKKQKTEKYQVVTREDDPKLYAKLDELIDTYHKSQLADAHITLAYVEDVKPDKEGFTMLHAVKLPSKIEKRLHGQDLIVVLNGNVWRSTPSLHDAILDEALCEIVPDTDKEGCRKYDQKDRPLYHLRKPPIRAFSENVNRFGFWQPVVEAFVRATAPKLRAPDPSLFPDSERYGRREPVSISPSASEAIEAHAVGDGKEFRMFVRAKPAKSGQGMPLEVAREQIERFWDLANKGNPGAAKSIARKLEEAGWVEKTRVEAETGKAAAVA